MTGFLTWEGSLVPEWMSREVFWEERSLTWVSHSSFPVAEGLMLNGAPDIKTH